MQLTRRNLLRLSGAGTGLLCSGLSLSSQGKERAKFRLGLGTFTFRSQDLKGLAERCRALGLPAIELSHPEYMLPRARVETFGTVRDTLKSSGIELVSWYCGHLSKQEEISSMQAGVRMFGVKTVSGSAERELLDAVNAACAKDGFRFGIHNHYFKNRKFLYESPEDILSALRGRPNLFSTLDTGHMIAVGIDPVQAYEKLKSHVRIVHLKDEDSPGHGVVMGKGKADLSGFLTALVRSGFDGFAAIEYEEGTDPTSEVAECVRYVRARVSL